MCETKKQRGAVQARCSVKGGPLSQGEALIKRSFNDHNFINKASVVLKPTDLRRLLDGKMAGYLTNEYYIVKTDLSHLLKHLLFSVPTGGDEGTDNGNNMTNLNKIKLISLNSDVSHELSITLTEGILTMKLPSDLYYKSGFKGKLSSYSQGNKNLKSQMFKVSFNVSEVNIVKKIQDNKDKNYARLFWFADNVVSGKQFQFAITQDEEDGDFIVKAFTQDGVQLEKKHTISHSFNLGSCRIPDLKLKQDKDWVYETLEWISYISIDGNQVKVGNKTDPYISSYPGMLDSETESEVAVLNLQSGLINNHLIITKIFNELIRLDAEWFAITTSGVKDTNVSFRSSGEHGLVDNGENDMIVLKTQEEFLMARILGFGDSS